MNKMFIKAILLASVIVFSGCSTYNSYAPDWAKLDHLALRLKQAVKPLKINRLGGIHFLGRLESGNYGRI